MATLAQMRVLAARKLDQALVSGDVPTDASLTAFWTREDLNAWINEAYLQCYARLAEIEAQTLITETTVSYTANSRRLSLQTLLTVSVDPLKIVGVWDITNDSTGNGVLLPYHVGLSQQGGTTSSADVLFSLSGYSRGWSWAGFSPMYLYVWPRPSTALSLRIQYIPASPVPLADAGDGTTTTPSAIPPSHHDLLVMYAVVQAKRKEENESWKNDYVQYREMLDAFINSVEERQQQTSRSVYVTSQSDNYHDW